MRSAIAKAARAITILASACAGLSIAGAGDAATVRIGYQKAAVPLVLLRAESTAKEGPLDADLRSLGYAAEWKVFESGPPLLEALRTGSVDFGYTGAPPPIFAQAGGVDLVYVAASPPDPLGQGIVVRKDSPLRSVGDLAGKRVGLQKGSSAQYHLIQALEAHGLSYGDVTPVYLTPSDARPAFESARIDAWAIWDPYLADVEKRAGARTLLGDADSGVAANRSFYLATGAFAGGNAEVIDVLLRHIRRASTAIAARPHDVAALLAADTGVEARSWELSLQRGHYGVAPLDDDVLAEQQKIADVFHRLGLISLAIHVRESAWRPRR